MPSGYEPCGLGQLIALRYGSVPLVHATGGLADTIRDPRRHPDTANGFTFEEFTGAALLTGLDRLLTLRATAPAAWRLLQHRGMTEDLSWQRAAADYLTLYRTILEDLP
jgi:starch synthase